MIATMAGSRLREGFIRFWSAVSTEFKERCCYPLENAKSKFKIILKLWEYMESMENSNTQTGNLWSYANATVWEST